MTEQERQKRLAAAAAVEEVRDGMVVGLGTGSTAAFAVEMLGERVREGLRIVGVATSERTAERARSLNIPLATLNDEPLLDLTIDGADEVGPELALVKGLGGALLREKLVAVASRRMIVVVDAVKLVDRLGRGVVPLEVVAFGVESTLGRLRGAGATAQPRRKGTEYFRTDEGNLIADCRFAPIDDPGQLHARLKAITGVVETGLFVGIASRAIAGGADGLTIIEAA